MNYTLFLFAFAFLITSSFLTFIIARGDGSKATKSYIIYLIFALCWQFGDIFLSTPDFPLYAVKSFAKIHAFFWMPIPFLYLYFIYQFLGRKEDIYLWIQLLFIPAALIRLWTSNQYYTIITRESWGVSLLTSSQAIPFIILLLGITPCYGIYILIRSYQTMPWEKRYQINNLLTGILLLLIPGVSISIILRDVFKLHEVPPVTSSLIVLQSGFALRAMIKHQLLQPKINQIIDNLLYRISEGIILLNTDGEIVTSNLRAQEMTTLFNDDLFSTQFVPPLPDQEFNHKRVTLKNEPNRTLLVGQNNIYRKGVYMGRLIILNDITTLVSLEQSLTESRNKALQETHFKSRALANISHEFKTPLNIIMGYTQLIDQIDQLSPEQQSELHIVADNSTKLLSLLNHLLQKAKSEYIPPK